MRYLKNKKQAHLEKDTINSLKTESNVHHVGIILLLFLITILLVTTYTFLLQRVYTQNAIDAEVDRDITSCDAVYRIIDKQLTRDDFDAINTKKDKNKKKYHEIQSQLNGIRTLNATRYLYTAKRNKDGKLIYAVDGLDLDAVDFRNPGDYIEKEMIPYIEKALSGKITYSQEIIDTNWGHIFTACYPVRANDDSNKIIGALCMEMDMESAYKFVEKGRHTSTIIAGIAILVTILLAVNIYFYLRNQKIKEAKQRKILAKAAKVADSANKAKSTFLFNMSHDIRTPMNAIIGYAELAGRHLKEPERLDNYIKKICFCGQKMLSIIDGILELARIENNQTIIEKTVVNINKEFDACIDMFYTDLKEKKQELILTKNIIYPYVYMDKLHVSEIMLNIISNAIKYTGNSGKITCDISQYSDSKKEGFCITRICVTDTGIGMSEEFQKHIFESFSRERSSTISGIDGSGLGMGIVKKLVNLMDGDIQVKSKLGEGTQITVFIPCRIVSKIEEDNPIDFACKKDKFSIKGKRILLAEDNELNAEIAMELLGEEGLIIDRAENGLVCAQMLEKAEAGYYSLILMDLQMPVLDGYLATKKIRALEDKQKANIPIIAMTANAFEEDRKKALSVGMNDHVAKPVDMGKLIPILEHYME